MWPFRRRKPAKPEQAPDSPPERKPETVKVDRDAFRSGILVFPQVTISRDTRTETLRSQIDSGALSGRYGNGFVQLADSLESGGEEMIAVLYFGEDGVLRKISLEPIEGAMRYLSYTKCCTFLKPLLENPEGEQFDWGRVSAYEIPDYHDDYCGGEIRILFQR